MKTINHFLLITCLSTGTSMLAAEPTPGVPTHEAPDALATALSAGTKVVSSTNAVVAASAAEPPVVVKNGTNGLRLNFHKAPLNLVLDYLSDAAGFIINREDDVLGTVDVQGKDLTKDETVEVLNSALRKNGYAVIRNGRILNIVALDTARTKYLEVVSGNDPNEVEKSSEVMTQIIPVKYASVSQLVPNLELLLPTTATLSANENANSLILVATKTDIKRMLKIIAALDTAIARVSSIRVIPLKHADAKDTATLITALFSSQGGSQGGNTGSRGNLFSMSGDGGPLGSGGAAIGGGGGAAAKVVAVGDDRSNSLVVSAPADLVATIESMVKGIDQEVTDVTELRVFRLVNADASEIADQLSQLFPDPTSSTSGSQDNIPLFMGGPFGGGQGATTATAAGSERAKKMGRILALPDPRTSAIIVMASKTLMPQIADMIAELDADQGRKEFVGFYDLQDADPQDVYNNLQDLFNRSIVRQSSSANQNPLMGTASPLWSRVRSNPQSTVTTSSTMGTSSGTGGSKSTGGGF